MGDFTCKANQFVLMAGASGRSSDLKIEIVDCIHYPSTLWIVHIRGIVTN